MGTPKQRRNRFIVWGVRSLIAIALYTGFWDQQWVRWTLIAYIPLHLFGLLSAYGWNIFLNRRLNKTLKKIEEAEKLLSEEKESSRSDRI